MSAVFRQSTLLGAVFHGSVFLFDRIVAAFWGDPQRRALALIPRCWIFGGRFSCVSGGCFAVVHRNSPSELLERIEPDLRGLFEAEQPSFVPGGEDFSSEAAEPFHRYQSSIGRNSWRQPMFRADELGGDR